MVSTVVPDSAHKLFIGGLPNYLNDDQVSASSSQLTGYLNMGHSMSHNTHILTDPLPPSLKLLEQQLLILELCLIPFFSFPKAL